MLAYAAHDAATMAMAAYMDAKAASDDAAAATDIATATAAKIKAENGPGDGREPRDDGQREKHCFPGSRATMELMIDDKTKTVGDNSITIDRPAQ